MIIDASLWSADLTNLRGSIAEFDARVDWYHFDVADGHFAPALLFFPDLIAQLRPLTDKPFHIHLMAERPSQWIEPLAGAGADRITIHAENSAAERRACFAHAKVAGLALTLDTDVEAAIEHVEDIGLVLLLGTRVGVKGQPLDPRACGRIAKLRRLLPKGILIEADGGIRAETVPLLEAAGADAIVPGSLLFGSR